MINFEKIYKSLGNYRLVYGMCLIPILLGIIIDSHNPNSHDDIRLVVFIGIPLYIGTFLAVVIDGFINYISKKEPLLIKKLLVFICYLFF